MKPRPLHPFPIIVSNNIIKEKGIKLNRFEVEVLKYLKNGAHLLFDMRQKKALLYSFKRGFQQICEMSVRTLSKLLYSGFVVMVARQDKLVHYNLNINKENYEKWFDLSD
jgi:hypothetical protein